MTKTKHVEPCNVQTETATKMQVLHIQKRLLPRPHYSARVSESDISWDIPSPPSNLRSRFFNLLRDIINFLHITF